MSAMEIDLRNISEERTRHGRVVVYARLGGRRIRLRAKIGTPEFVDEYRAAIKALRTGHQTSREKTASSAMPRGTLGWLVETYMRESVEFRSMRDVGQKRRRTRLAQLVMNHGTKPALMQPANIMAGLAKRATKPGSANIWLKDIKALYGWALKAGYVPSNPAAGIGKIKYKASSHHPWTLGEIAKYLKHHAGDDRALLAVLFLLITGLRRDDATRAGRQHIRDGRLILKASKNAEERNVALPPCLLALIERTSTQALAILTNNKGDKFGSGAAFGNWFRDRCDEADLHHCSAHGLRHALATIASENSASAHEIMSLLADRDIAQAQNYTRTAEARKMADSGLLKVLGAIQNTIETVAPSLKVADGATKSAAK